ncbi:tRNA (adenine(58)-N(1))-methyltransferase TrmI [Colletotrichum chlorophyti]|uniref:tRNA (adenine(58)-N(1))-methyltransferase catalytic subunit TRM61 n=1 Tax=Colletotrichum chlorophyti TaxID=708187 RepID=A0A1Q8RX68_9PEZI|nr:tRNA (adenine(58)-N(1))-methyltransferase TrmI [Colletotrichum chlorophyti]
MPLRFGSLGIPKHLGRPSCRFSSSQQAIREHDVVVLRQRGPREAKFHLSPPVRQDNRIKLTYGATVNGSDIIGKRFTECITDSGGRNVRLYEASLAQYVANSPRVATPIYPQDANLIVSFLDINLPVPGEDPDFDAGPPVEIFEAGTGMGALTLHLARAIHGANPPVPPQLRDALCDAPYTKHSLPKKIVADDDAPFYETSPHALDFPDAEQASLHNQHVSGRRAIIHTLDVNPTSSRAAHSLVRHFRRGRYLLDVEFHVRTIRSYLSSRLAETGGEPFLSHVILDLPGSQNHADVAVDALLPGGKMVVFFPSITQILEFVVWAKDSGQLLALDRVVELPTATSGADGMFRDGTGGRNWEVKVVNIRKASESEEVGAAARAHVCRPKVGTLVVGGGFVAVFSRLPQQMASAAQGVEPEAESASEYQSTSNEDEPQRPQ